MEHKDRAFVELTFTSEVQDRFSKLVNKIVPINQLYFSSEVEHIKGNITHALHFTVFFGLQIEDMQEAELNDILSKYKIESLKLGKLFFIPGFKNMYKILAIEVLDQNGELLNFNTDLFKFAGKRNQFAKQREFKPHISLAYVDNDYQITDLEDDLPSEIPVANTKVSLVSDFNKKVNNIK